MTAEAQHDRIAIRSRYAELSVVRDGDGYVLGSPYSDNFVAVPDLGGRVVQWLQAGHDPAKCAELAARYAGEPVDVEGFLAGLVSARMLPAEVGSDVGSDVAVAEPRAGAAARIRGPRMGRIVFGRTGLATQCVLSVAAVVVVVTTPYTRPTYSDAILTGVPLLSLIAVAVLGTASALVHECAHVLAAAAAGVPGSVSISRRLFTIVWQTDLTRLWSVPRRTRVVPLLAGILSDGATIGLLLLAEVALDPPSPALHLLRTIVFLKVAGIAFQLEVFMRTDVYALFAVATGCRNLWATKGAVARRAVGLATEEDRAVLVAAGRHEIGWARVYLLLYVPGVAWSVWYFAVFVVPAIQKIIVMSIDAVAGSGLFSLMGATGAAALLLTVASTAFVLAGTARTLTRLARRLTAGLAAGNRTSAADPRER
jgi:putative peptide zinc metalloprotease protein